MKTCSKCKAEKEEEEFYKSNKTKDGLRSWCIKCQLEDNRKRESNYNETRRKYRAENQEKYRETKKQYYESNKKKVLENNALWRQTLTGRLLSYKRAALKRGIDWHLTDEQFESFWGNSCTYCASEIKGIGIDRINSKEGYYINNVVPCCSTCNKMKMDLDLTVFTSKILEIFKNKGKWENLTK